MRSMNLLLRDPSCNKRRKVVLNSTSRDLLKMNELDGFRNQGTRLIKTGHHCSVLRSEIPFSYVV